MTLRVVTDSTADIPDKIARQLGIVVIPLNIHFGEEILKDGEDIWAEEFFHRIVYESVPPHTSQPSPREFADVYHRTSQPGETILSIHLSSQLSKTFHTAEQAASLIHPDRKVIPIDSGLVSMGLGWVVIETARAVAEGGSLEEILKRIEELRQSVHIYFSVETMEFLHRTGRYMIEERPQFNQRPILSIQQGKIVTIEYFKGSNGKMGEHMLGLIREDMNGQPYRIALIHANLSEEIERIRESLCRSGNGICEIIATSVSPIVGAHSGPGMFGVIAVPVRS